MEEEVIDMEEEMIGIELTKVEAKLIYDLLSFVKTSERTYDVNKRLRKRWEAALDILSVIGSELNYPYVNHKDFCMVGNHNRKEKGIWLIDRNSYYYEDGQW